MNVNPLLHPNIITIQTFLFALFAPGFANRFPDALIEIAHGYPSGKLDHCRHFSVFDLENAIAYAVARNNEGQNVYVIPALLKGDTPTGRAKDANVFASRYFWAEYDGAGDAERIDAIMKANQLEADALTTTGTVPHLRQHIYFRAKDGVTDINQLLKVNTALRDLFHSDDVQNPARLMRLAGTVNYPSAKKLERGYVVELTSLKLNAAARSYTPEHLIALTRGSKTNDPFDFNNARGQRDGKSNDELIALLEKGRVAGHWHNSIRDAVATMIGRGWPDDAIRLACAPYCERGIDDPDLDPLIDGGRAKWDKPANNSGTSSATTGNLIVSSADFLKGFVPPDYLIVGLLQRRFIYSFTGLTGSAKTAIALLLAANVALGRAIGEYEVEKGRVLFLAGENPDDIRMRWMAMAEHHEFNVDEIPVHFLPGVFKLSEIGMRIKAELEKIGPVSLVIIDTSAAYFEGDEENDNIQMIVHAHRLRDLITLLPGEPCIVVCCHPIKNATPENMLPRGGGAFVNEMDGNLTSAKTEAQALVHWCGKFRGPEFAPIPFALMTATAKGLEDGKGRKIMTVVAKPMSEEESKKAEAAARSDEDDLLLALAKIGHPPASMAHLALMCNWRTKDNKPNKSKVQRAAERLKKDKLVTIETHGLDLTPKGLKRAAKLDDAT